MINCKYNSQVKGEYFKMGLRKFNGRIESVNNRKKFVIIAGIILVLITLLIYQSYAVYKANNKVNVLESRVGSFGISDIKLAVLVDGEKVDEFPSKTSGKYMQSAKCGSGTAIWDYINWEVNITNILKPTECTINFVTTTANGPDIVDGMIPVSYDASGKTIKAEANNIDNNWYDYNNFKWANMVLVSSASRLKYQNAEKGTQILETDILAYYVWIPRYRYQLFNASNENKGIPVQEIAVIFEDKDTTPSCGGNECSANRIYDSGINDEWLTHPAFTFGDTELNGIWVGKFELTGTTTAPTIKSKILSLRNINVSTAFTTILNFKTSADYGISTSNMDSHMMKNMEWGAVAYLSQSKYGKYGNSNYYTAGKPGVNNEIYRNNNHTGTSAYNTNTGCSGGSSSVAMSTSCLNPFPATTLASTGASTTGTIYGIYDMNGGAYEYVMGNMATTNANYLAYTMNQQSAGTTFGTYTNENLPKKYYDIYDTGTNIQHNRGKLGDATKETLTIYGSLSGGWYEDVSGFVNTGGAWFIRGYNAAWYNIDDSLAGIFASGGLTGVAEVHTGTRGSICLM